MMWILRDYGYDGLKRVGDMRLCEDATCTGTGIVLRISVSMVLFSSFLSLLVCGVESTENPRAPIQNDFWILKWLMMAGITTGALYFSNESMVSYGYVAAVGGGFFVLLQAILVLEFAYGWNDGWVERYEETENRNWAVLILGTALTLFGLSITIWVMLLKNFGGDGCDETNTFVALTIVMSVISTAITLPDKVQQGAILPCSVIILQCSILCASAVVSIPTDNDSSCAGRHSMVAETDAALVRAAGVIVTIFCVGYATIRAASSGQDLVSGPRPDTALMDAEKGGEDIPVEAEQDEEDKVQYSYSFFHVTYALGAMYLAMVMVDWQVSFDDKNGTLGHMDPWVSVWIKMVSQWLTFLLYIWTLIAPLVCTDRDFS